MHQLHSAAGLAAVGLMAVGSMPEVASSEPAERGTRGVICGRDNGRGRAQPRNLPCGCGSGIKAKKCCGSYPKKSQ